jgi:hypothetical protein
VRPDVIPANGLRARVTCLTLPALVRAKTPQFDGSLKWLGVSDSVRYELAGEGTLHHRRVLFSSTSPWPNQLLFPIPGGAPGDYARQPAVGLDDLGIRSCLNRMFVDQTVRGIMTGPINPLGVTVFESKTKVVTSSSEETLRFQKLWNGFGPKGAGAMMQFKPSPHNGAYGGDLLEKSFPHIFVLDVFAQGLAIFDCVVPRAVPPTKKGDSAESMPGVDLTPSTSRTSSTGSAAKRPKMEDDIEGMSLDDKPADDREMNILKSAEKQGSSSTNCKVISMVKLYYATP